MSGGYVDPFIADEDSVIDGKRQARKDKARADAFDREVLFQNRSSYRASPEALRQLAARAGYDEVPQEWLSIEARGDGQ